jgi:RHS repeat-associated protein
MVYDALGRCVTRTLTGGPTTYYVYDGEKPILEYDRNGTSVGTNVYGKGIDEIVKRVAIGFDTNSYTYYPQQNHEGSVNELTDTNGNVIERYRYDAFGAPTFYTGTWGTRSNTIYDNRFLFTGREYAATYRSTYTTPGNFYEYRARAYNPILGRFMSEDPKLFDAGDYNLFRYCHNDPIDFTDPMGLAREMVGVTNPREKSFIAELRDRVQQALRDAARAKAYAKADTWSGHSIERVAAMNRATAKPRSPSSILREPVRSFFLPFKGANGQSSYRAITIWRLTLLDEHQKPTFGAGIFVGERIDSHSNPIDYIGHGEQLGGHDSYPGGWVGDTWALTYSSLNGKLTTQQTILVGGHEATWNATTNARGEVEEGSELWAPFN